MREANSAISSSTIGHSYVQSLKPLDTASDPIELYDIKECIGKGNFGDVYRAIERSSNTVVAVKVVNLEETDDEIGVLVQEISFLSQLRSEFITNYFNTYLRDVSMWIVMEYCGGGSCADLLKCHKKLSEEVVSFIIRDTLKGLDYLHNQRKVHRDIKAANILLTSMGQIKLADFGVSGQITATHVKKDTFVGTPFWMAPEIILRRTGYNEKVDIWSLGITTIELVTGSPPFSECEPMKVLFQIPKNPPPILVGSSYSEYIKEFVKFCLIKNPANRPDTSLLLKTKFIRSCRRNVSLVPLIQQKDQWMSVHRPNAKRPRYDVNQKLYSESEASLRWSFQATTIKGNPDSSDISQHQHSDYSPESEVSPRTEGLIDSSETEMTSPEIGVGESSPTAIIHDISGEKNQQRVPHSLFKTETQIDYLNDVILPCFKAVHNRAKTTDTRLAVRTLGKLFVQSETNQPGLSEALSEEIWLRMSRLSSKPR